MLTILRKSLGFIIATGLLMSSSLALAGGSSTYQVTITNLTNAISFTPILVASHRKPIELFVLGTPASAELTAVAETGNVAPLTALLHSNPDIIDVQNSGALLGPGETIMVMLNARGAKYISVASMMLPTNDGFIALDSVRAPSKKKTNTYYSPGYDSGTELNDELCIHIPGPTCHGVQDPSDGVAEGYVHIHRGIHGIADLAADTYDWRNPVAKITIVRTK